MTREELAWLLACQCMFDINLGRSPSLVTASLCLYDGTAKGMMVRGFGNTTNSALQDLKTQLLRMDMPHAAFTP